MSVKRYRSVKTGQDFSFHFVAGAGGVIDIYCLSHPPLNGEDSSVHNTHLYSSGKICFVAGKEPRSQQRAEQLAGQWAEYFCEYARSGVPQA